LQEGVTLKRLSHALLSATQADIDQKETVGSEQIDKLQSLIDTSILVFVDSLSSALKTGLPSSAASSLDLSNSHWTQRSGPVTSRSAEANITRDRSFSSPPTLTESQTDEELKKHEKMRKNVLNEILSTETIYFTQLKKVVADVRE
jgi:hypothetical protein